MNPPGEEGDIPNRWASQVSIKQRPSDEIFGEKPRFEEVVIGQEDLVEKPLILKKPFFVSKPVGSPPTSFEKIAAEFASSMGTFYSPSSPGKVDATAVWCPSRRGVSPGGLRKASVVELRLSEVLSDGGLSWAVGHVERSLSGHITVLREAMEYAVPVVVRITGGDIYREVKKSFEAGADAVIISPRENVSPGTGAHPLSLFPPAKRAAKEAGAAAKGQRILYEGARTGFEWFVSLAMGADAVGLDLWKTGTESVGRGNLISGLEMMEREALSLIGLTGHKSQKELDMSILETSSYDVAVVTGINIAGYDREAPMWLHSK